LNHSDDDFLDDMPQFATADTDFYGGESALSQLTDEPQYIIVSDTTVPSVFGTVLHSDEKLFRLFPSLPSFDVKINEFKKKIMPASGSANFLLENILKM
jgi:hypothetical protein